MDRLELRNRFRYHAPTPARAAQHEKIRNMMSQVAGYLNDDLPEGREKALVMTKLEEVMFWANAAIARS